MSSSTWAPKSKLRIEIRSSFVWANFSTEPAGSGAIGTNPITFVPKGARYIASVPPHIR